MHFNEDSSQSGDDEISQIVMEVEPNEEEIVSEVSTTNKPTASMKKEDRPEYGPHLKPSRGEDLCEYRKKLSFVFVRPFPGLVCGMLSNTRLQSCPTGKASLCGHQCCCYCQVPNWAHFHICLIKGG